MPTRLIYEKTCVSETLAQCTAEEERMFFRLVVKADDHGRYDARPAVLLAHLFTLQTEQITAEMVRNWRDRLEEVGLIRTYVVDGREYLVMLTWGGHQRQRANSSKYPEPPFREHPRADADSSEHPPLARRQDRYPEPGNDTRSPVPDTRCPEPEAGGAGGDSLPEPDHGADAPPKPKRAKPRGTKPRTDPPETLEPNDADYARGELHGMSREEVDSKAATMLDYHRREGKDSADWHASLRTWLDNARLYDQPRASPNGHRNGSSKPPPRRPGPSIPSETSAYLQTRNGPLQPR